eukprot:COSAG06_NODE_6989_length_2685_cov_5.871230_4_plen_180_part_00
MRRNQQLEMPDRHAVLHCVVKRDPPVTIGLVHQPKPGSRGDPSPLAPLDLPSLWPTHLIVIARRLTFPLPMRNNGSLAKTHLVVWAQGAARAVGVGVATVGGYRVRRQRGPVVAPLRRASPPCEAGCGCTTVVSARDHATVHAVLSTARGCSAGLSRASTARGAPWRQIGSLSTFAAHV